MTKKLENPIASALKFEDRIVIIPREEAEEGETFLKKELRRYTKKVSLMPIYGAAEDLGNFVSDGEYIQNPIWISHTGPGNEYLPEPYCKKEPDYHKILMQDGTTLPVVMLDPISESQGSILKTMETVNRGIDKINTENDKRYAYPSYLSLVLISKIAEGDQVLIPNLINAFWVHKDIWLNGRGPDNDKLGRKDLDVMGVLSPHATQAPPQPYYKRLF